MTSADPATLERARAAKEKLREQLANLPELRGIGIAMLEGGYGVKVNLLRQPETLIPEDIDGVPIVTDIIGRVVSQ
jgi:hypothetical protein